MFYHTSIKTRVKANSFSLFQVKSLVNGYKTQATAFVSIVVTYKYVFPLIYSLNQAVFVTLDV